MLRLAHFGTIILTALILAPGLAHLFALPNKMSMDQEAYFNAQAAYRGWALFAVPIFAVILLDGWLAFSARNDGLLLYLFVFAGVVVVGTLVIFVLWVWPGNQATQNWVEVPPNWRELRTRWEFGHAASAVLTLASLIAMTAAAFLRCARTTQ